MGTSAWFIDVAQAALSRNCTYLHASALRRGAKLGDDLRSALVLHGLDPHIADCRSVPAVGGWDGVLPRPEELDRNAIVLVWGPEVLASRRDFRPLLAQSRPRGQDLLAAGIRLMVVSCRPKTWFPEPDGSSLIADASKIHPVPVSAATIKAVDGRIDDEAAARISGFAAGSVSLAQKYIDIELMDISSRRKRAEAEVYLKETLELAVDELGPEALALLEHFVLDLGTYEVPEEDVPASFLAAWTDAGVAKVDDATGHVEMFAGAWRPAVKECLTAALEKTIAPPADWRRLVESLFTYERFVRLTLAAHLRAKHGASWCSEGLGPLSGKALVMAQGEGYSASNGADDLPTPLDWLLLEELLEVARGCSAGGHVGGVSQREWERHAAVMIPIRNRVMHMRLPRPGDLQAVRSRLHFLQVRVRSSELNLPATDARSNEL